MGNGILCAGDVYFDRLDPSGVATGLIYMFDAKQFAINHPSEDKDRITRGRSNFGQLGDTVKIPGAPTLAIKGDEISAAVLALALMGTAAAATQASGTVTEAAVTLKKDVWNQLPQAYIDASGFVLTNSAGSTTYVEDTDYKVNRRLGLVMALTNGAAGANNKLSYTYSAATGSIITGGDSPIIKGRWLCDGKNLATQRDVIVDIDEATVAPTEALDFTSGDYVPVSLAGKMRTLAGKTRPYTVQLR